jgi:Transposase-associated domain
MKRLDREWMDKRLDANKKPNIEYRDGVLGFLEMAKKHAVLNERPDQIKCPCAKCDNRKSAPSLEVRNHLYRWGFRNNYYTWSYHGEVVPRAVETSKRADESSQNPYTELVEHALRPVIDQIMVETNKPDEILDEQITSRIRTCEQSL